MQTELDFLHVRREQIVNAQDQVVRLRGLCLGGWMCLENFMLGYPGHESGARAAVARVLGEGRAHFFFERLMDYILTEDDFAFIRRLGCNVIRIPLNHRHFESDARPFEYEPAGFRRLDQAIEWARAYDLYVILDLHTLPGCQNAGWHSDNGCQTAHFWGQKAFEDRAVALWEEIARRYRDQAVVAGFNVMNEPAVNQAIPLNEFYRRVTAALRAIDSRHILFLEGNSYSQQFDELDAPFDTNTAYSSHNYVVPALERGEYPGEFLGIKYDRARLEQEYLERVAFMRRHRVPNWVGEFGALFGDHASEDSRLHVLSDLIGIYEQHGHGWALWTYKDLGWMGLVALDLQSEWMERTRPVRAAKSALRCDYWIERGVGKLDATLADLVARARSIAGELPVDWAQAAQRLNDAVYQGVFSQMLLPAFAEQFRGMSENEIDRMMQSFLLRNCIPRAGLVKVITDRTRELRAEG